MILILENDKNEPNNLRAFDNSPDGYTIYGEGVEVTISLESLLELAEYAIINSNLVESDPRLPFVKKIRQMHIVTGYGGNPERRLKSIPFDTTTT